jgi:hypothetical protein
VFLRPQPCYHVQSILSLFPRIRVYLTPCASHHRSIQYVLVHVMDSMAFSTVYRREATEQQDHRRYRKNQMVLESPYVLLPYNNRRVVTCNEHFFACYSAGPF